MYLKGFLLGCVVWCVLQRVGFGFECDGGARELDDSLVDDDFCDCEDGSDEPRTSACAHVRGRMFECATTPLHFSRAGVRASGVRIPSSRVNDGVCDCCDGSDEVRSNWVECENGCLGLGGTVERVAKEAYFHVAVPGFKRGQAMRNISRSVAALWASRAATNAELSVALTALESRLEKRIAIEETMELSDQQHLAALLTPGSLPHSEQTRLRLLKERGARKGRRGVGVGGVGGEEVGVGEDEDEDEDEDGGGGVERDWWFGCLEEGRQGRLGDGVGQVAALSVEGLLRCPMLGLGFDISLGDLLALSPGEADVLAEGGADGPSELDKMRNAAFATFAGGGRVVEERRKKTQVEINSRGEVEGGGGGGGGGEGGKGRGWSALELAMRGAGDGRRVGGGVEGEDAVSALVSGGLVLRKRKKVGSEAHLTLAEQRRQGILGSFFNPPAGKRGGWLGFDWSVLGKRVLQVVGIPLMPLYPLGMAWDWAMERVWLAMDLVLSPPGVRTVPLDAPPGNAAVATLFDAFPTLKEVSELFVAGITRPVRIVWRRYGGQWAWEQVWSVGPAFYHLLHPPRDTSYARPEVAALQHALQMVRARREVCEKHRTLAWRALWAVGNASNWDVTAWVKQGANPELVPNDAATAISILTTPPAPHTLAPTQPWNGDKKAPPPPRMQSWTNAAQGRGEGEGEAEEDGEVWSADGRVRSREERQPPWWIFPTQCLQATLGAYKWTWCPGASLKQDHVTVGNKRVTPTRIQDASGSDHHSSHSPKTHSSPPPSFQVTGDIAAPWKGVEGWQTANETTQQALAMAEALLSASTPPPPSSLFAVAQSQPGKRSQVWGLGGGDRCPNGVQRSAQVVVVCGQEPAILDAEEPSVCNYALLATHPAACTAKEKEAARILVNLLRTNEDE